MEKSSTPAADIKIQILIRKGCTFSNRVLEQVHHICRKFPNTLLEIITDTDPVPVQRSFAGITPSIWVNEQLWYLGSFNAEKFEKKLTALSDR